MRSSAGNSNGSGRRGFDTIRTIALLLVFGLFPALALPVAAQDAAPPTDEPAGEIETLEKQQAEGRERLEQIKADIEVSEQRRAELEQEITSLKHDQASLRTALLQSAKTQKKLSNDISDGEKRLAALAGRQEAIRASLRSRKAILAEVLAALQRMGRNPPPAILISPDDALASVRSAILLGAVVPEIREETGKLVADLQELTEIHASIANERERLIATLGEQAEEEEKLNLLLEEKNRLATARNDRLDEERRKAEDLAMRASSLNDLIASLGSEIESAREAAEQARLAEIRRTEETERRREQLKARKREGDPDIERMAPAYAFSELSESLELPVRGEVTASWGDDDGTGNELMGTMVSTQPEALVTSPADGWVVYAGNFRSYGQLLILNVGEEYNLVLAGMGRIDASIGQFVVAGEPVGRMSSRRLAAMGALSLASDAPTLYIEFRKDGKPIDPGPWWVKSPSGRISNDS